MENKTDNNNDKLENRKKFLTHEKVITFTIGLLTGAIIATAGFLIYVNAVGIGTNNSSQSMQMPGGTPPEMPNGEMPNGENGTPPELPNGERSDGENNTPPELPNGERSGGENDTPPELPNGERSDGENGTPPAKPSEKSGEQNDEQ